MFEAWGHIIFRHRRLVLAVAAVAVVCAAVWGTGVFGKLQSAGGFAPPASQSQQEANHVAAVFGRDAGDVVLLYKQPHADRPLAGLPCGCHQFAGQAAAQPCGVGGDLLVDRVTAIRQPGRTRDVRGTGAHRLQRRRADQDL